MHVTLAGCMFIPTMELELSLDDRRILSSMLRSTTLGAGLVRRARVILALADGDSYATICAKHGVTDKFIAQWKRRVVAGGIPRWGIARIADVRIDWIRGSKRRFSPRRGSRRRPR